LLRIILKEVNNKKTNNDMRIVTIDGKNKFSYFVVTGPGETNYNYILPCPLSIIIEGIIKCKLYGINI